MTSKWSWSKFFLSIAFILWNVFEFLIFLGKMYFCYQIVKMREKWISWISHFFTKKIFDPPLQPYPETFRKIWMCQKIPLGIPQLILKVLRWLHFSLFQNSKMKFEKHGKMAIFGKIWPPPAEIHTFGSIWPSTMMILSKTLTSTAPKKFSTHPKRVL